MSGSTSLETPLLEQIRSNREEIERLEQLVMKDLMTEQLSPTEKLSQGHRLRSMTKSIILKTEKLVKTYEEKVTAAKDGIAAPLGDKTETWTAFSNRLEEILEWHGKHPSGPLADADFEALLVGADYGAQIAPIEHARLEKPQSLIEAKVNKLCNLLDETIKRTKQMVEKKQDLEFGEMEEENPMEQAMGWDGKPIPYWLNKLGLGLEYKCEICRNHSYWGKKAFERHFQEWRHQWELDFLGILDREKNFKGITSIEEAKQLWKRQGGQCRDEEIIKEKNSNQAPVGVAIPPPYIRRTLERVALIVSKKGLEHEGWIIAKYGEEDAELKFLKSSDPYHAFYQHKLTEYMVSPQNQDATHSIQYPHHAAAGAPYSGYYYDDDSETDDLPDENMVCPPSLETHKFTYRLPEGITPKELDIIKLTAEFWARCGRCILVGFRKRVVNDPHFEFMNKPTEGRFTLFETLVSAYLEVLKGPPLEVLKEKLRNNAADIETVLENCYHRLQWDRFQRERLVKKAREERAKHLVKKAREERAKPPPPRRLSINSKLRPPPPQLDEQTKRQKIDKSEVVPEEEFLAQHPGGATIRVCIPDVMDANFEIVVPSLLETVASLKEKMALLISVPASKQKLSGKTGFLKDNRSLAHNNVEPRDILILSCEER